LILLIVIFFVSYRKLVITVSYYYRMFNLNIIDRYNILRFEDSLDLLKCSSSIQGKKLYAKDLSLLAMQDADSYAYR
jgi:hypothetical protein